MSKYNHNQNQGWLPSVKVAHIGLPPIRLNAFSKNQISYVPSFGRVRFYVTLQSKSHDQNNCNAQVR